ncbi:MAG: cell division protein ZapA [Bacteroidales bacterium]|nr:cell division protein ZapA [Bacteroidales bacterium]
MARQRITLRIGGRELELSVEAAKEEGLRAAAGRINKELEALRFDFRNQDLSDLLSIILLSEETKLMELEARNVNETNRQLRLLEMLDADLGQYLSR